MPASPGATFEKATLDPSAASRPGFVVRKVGDVILLDLAGSVTRDQPTHFRERVQEFLDGGTRKFVVNLAQVDYIDSSGVGTLVVVYKWTREAGAKCKFLGAPPQVLHTLQRANLHKVFELFEDEGAALSSF